MGRIIREYMTPWAFRQQDYAGGLEAAAQRLVRLIDGEVLPPPRALSRRGTADPGYRIPASALSAGGAAGTPARLVLTLGASVALAAALALGRHWPAGAMVAPAESGGGPGRRLRRVVHIRAEPAGSSPFLCSMRWAVLGLPPLWPAGAHYGLAVPLSLTDPADAGRCLAGAAQRTALGSPAGLLGLLLTLALECRCCWWTTR